MIPDSKPVLHSRTDSEEIKEEEELLTSAIIPSTQQPVNPEL